MELATLVLSVVSAIAQVIAGGVKQGDWSWLDRPVKELLPEKLKTSLAKARAEAEAEAKFGTKA